MRGMTKEKLDSYLDEYMWRSWFFPPKASIDQYLEAGAAKTGGRTCSRVDDRSTKVTNEPPAGLRAGLLRSFTVLVDQDKLDRLESPSWRTLLFAVCFLHAVVVERRKFGSLGFSVPYEFNAGDMGASLSFLERHLYTSPTPSWPTVQYMVAEVHYGGRITDELDRRLFRAYCDAWFNPTLLGNSFSFNPEAKLSTGTGTVSSSGQLFNYCLPDSSMAEIEEYHRFIAGFPSVDSPEVFGLHPNADLTYRVKEVSALLGTIVDTQPADAESNSGSSTAASKPGVVETREDMIQHKIRERGIAGTGSALKGSWRWPGTPIEPLLVSGSSSATTRPEVCPRFSNKDPACVGWRGASYSVAA
ncbi:hypothetical protein ON010_g4268 [Phytophthora cinnamomi]|nr:hypothetical protein ON010_g4268 [Phytophthora cinnamomi]